MKHSYYVVFFSNFECCIDCEHPKKDLILNENKNLEPIPNEFFSLALKSKSKCDKSFFLILIFF